MTGRFSRSVLDCIECTYSKT